MPTQNELTKRKEEHLRLCSSEAVAFKNLSSGFEHYSFIHYALTEVDIDSIELKSDFFGTEVNYPFFISCMTGGTADSVNINLKLAGAARRLNIPLGLGSQRYALGNNNFNDHFNRIREVAGDIPLIGNIGAAQVVEPDFIENLEKLIETSHIQAFAIHLNPAQELFQKEGETNFSGLLTAIARIKKSVKIPLIVKETGAGISAQCADELLWVGVDMIDVAGAGGTSWSGVEILRNGGDNSHDFWDWGLPTAYCVRTINELRHRYDFALTASGGINSGMEVAKALALGADFTSSARRVLRALNEKGEAGVVEMAEDWFDTVRKVMFLTGSPTLDEFRMGKIVRKEELI
ncbi:MAG: type 2 isopentenyl-diphosphate Delta-isomerase [Ignavibacteriales bacterium]|jgi:isopentenyl-diphosphate delta-isomerase, type 2|nr:MAG: type 2 isopentenyl-diphosphate Delta-isomerase [Ignavibacteriaceae bacterium]MBW7872875.1 type 2 isopentenyl-diphosphate Delta-isomerase [Ignavibacteria bacterium]MCZ2142496.1 type 2 isopentenyl-diphosphate Delta-isomerase [Ignavibacteriales bacterium]OQY71343.1 MAG: type 2 isopentenyl-diphosphate Delta-isomerase [Ignavibacteriales bacterium UTCHB3]MBV6445377.1 Isopentenyl-diphosphate delta-isomerase [Ignavibacteriaceae bacterium]